MDDEKIISLFFARDEQAIDETRKKYSGYLFTIAGRILKNREDAEESVSSTYHAAWNAMPPNHPNVLSLFLAKITRSISLNVYRRNHAVRRGGGEIPLALDELSECVSGGDTESEAEYDRLVESINRFLGSIRPEDRRIFVLRYWHLYSTAEIAARCGFTESKVKTALYRTRGKLRLHLIKEGFCP